MVCTYRFNLAGVNLDDPDTSGDEFLSQTIGVATNGSLAGAVDGACGVRFAGGDGADVDDVAVAATGEVDGKDGLSHVY